METLDYIARCPTCGRVVGWASGSLNKKDLAKTTGAWIRKGLSVERMSLEAAKAEPWQHSCDCESDPRESVKKRQKLFSGSE